MVQLGNIVTCLSTEGWVWREPTFFTFYYMYGVYAFLKFNDLIPISKYKNPNEILKLALLNFIEFF